ncbi:MAG: hypothetical protein LBU65_00770 [Planctomycetaceae bacterium]|jgi:hypothetical protein|nr:hypothetical protein [Planctomycetaceae bacterium]
MFVIEIPTNDPVKMFRAIRNKLYEDTKNMTWEERDEYNRQKEDACRRLAVQRRVEREREEKNVSRREL